MFAKLTYEGCYNNYQITTNLTHDIYAGYVANNNPAFNQNSPSYGFTAGWSDARWNQFYSARTTAEYAQLLRTFYFVDREKYKNAFYITRIYWAFLASMNTDTYGAMPFYIYANGRMVDEDVPYDSQEKVYDGIFRMLTQAVDSIQPGVCEFKFKEESDKCYQGDEEKWLRFANTLRLRLALRISNVDPDRARKEGEAALSNRWGLMQMDADNMRTIPKHAPVALGGIDAGGDENVLTMCSFQYNGDCVMSKDMEEHYKNLSTGGTTYTLLDEDEEEYTKIIDPRCAVSWWKPSPMDALKQGREFPFVDFTGCEIGNFDVQHTESVKRYSVTRTLQSASKVLDPKHWYSASRESVWLGYAECKFLLAEAALRGWNGVTESSETYFYEGIRASLNYYEISATDMDSYINGLRMSPNPFEGADKEAMLEQIITHKWMAVFPNGNEGWAEFRRTDYPRLHNVLVNSSGGEVPEGKFIKRIRYPFSEVDNPHKPSEYDTQGTRLWWDVSDTNDGDGARRTPNNFRKSMDII